MYENRNHTKKVGQSWTQQYGRVMCRKHYDFFEITGNEGVE
jgi:hypothetical protein